MGLFVWVLIGVTFGYASSIAAGLRGRNTLVWFWFGFYGSIVAFAVIKALPDRSVAAPPA